MRQKWIVLVAIFVLLASGLKRHEKKNKTILILGASGEVAQNFIKNYNFKNNVLLYDLKFNKILKKYKKNYFCKFSKEFYKKQINLMLLSILLVRFIKLIK